ncbi:MAG TPA: CoA pyrophosphatase [Oscillatoriaceae cyanobacterium]
MHHSPHETAWRHRLHDLLRDRDRLRHFLATRDRRVLPEIKPSAVLVPILERDGRPHLLLTRRSDTVRAHTGQICFPGGRVEPHDVDLLATALRETHEEIGLDPARVDVLGPLDDMATRLGQRITPYLGVIPDDSWQVVDPREVAYTLVLPLEDFLDPERLTIKAHALPEGTRDVYYYAMGDEIVWGATARIIHDALALLARGGVDNPSSEA